MDRIRQAFCAFILLLMISTMSHGQSRLNFPRTLSVQELATTGIALVNTSSSPVAATFNLYGSNGSLVTQSTLNVPATGQAARLASEILPGATGSGWIQVTSSSPELQGFELTGDFSTVVDGAGPAVESKQLAVIHFSHDDTLYIANTSSSPGTARITLNDAKGAGLAVKSIPLAAFQPAFVRVGDLNDDNNIDFVSISADVTVSASLTTKLPGGLDVGVINGVPVSDAPSDLYFPFAPSGPQGGSNWKTSLGIANIGTATQSVSLTFTPDSGPPVTIQRSVAPGASVGDSASNLFSLSSTTFTAGWIRVTGSGPLAGVVAYQDLSAGSLAVVSSQSTGATRFFFGHIASLSPWYTGVALLNAAKTTANVEISAIDSNGNLIGSTAVFSLAGGSRRTSLLSELVPAVLDRSSDGGFVFVRTTNGVPLLGFELFGHAVFPILANVQGFPLSSTSAFTAPVPAGPISGVSVSRLTFTDGSTAKEVFLPRNAIVYTATILNLAGNTGTAQVTFSVTDLHGQPMITASMSVPLPAASGDITYTSYIPSNAPSGHYSLAVTLAYQGKTTGKAANFDVAGDTDTLSIAQEAPISMTPPSTPQFVFRPGDRVRFLVAISNFTGQSTSGTVNYQFNGPGSTSLGSGSLTITIPAGLSTQNVDLDIPASSPEGILAFVSQLTAGGSPTAITSAITVVPASSAETIAVDSLWIADSSGVPRGGFAAGSSVYLDIWQQSTFAMTRPATVRYVVTAPNQSSILDRSIAKDMGNGPGLSALAINLPGDAASGTYTFQATITYQDNFGATRVSALSMPFTVGSNPPLLAQIVSPRTPAIADINGVFRTSFAPGETLLFSGSVFSTFTAPLTGSVRFEVDSAYGILLDGSENVTFNPGMYTDVVPIVTNPSNTSVPPQTYRFILSATAQGPASAVQTAFTIGGLSTPPLQ